MRFIQPGAKILCFSPHPDDTEFGVGATLSKYAHEIEARVIVMSDRKRTRNEQHNDEDQRRSVGALGLRGDCVRFVDELDCGVDRLPIRFFGTEESRDQLRMAMSFAAKEFEPDVVFVPGLKETFQDHSVLAEEAVRILRGRYSIFGYEVIKHNRYFQPNVFISIDEDHIQKKARAVGCFSEFTTRYYFDLDALRSLARVRALDAGYLGFAEAFELYRLAPSD